MLTKAPKGERKHLSAKHIVDLSKLLEKHLITFDDHTCDYKEGYSDDRLRDIYGEPTITPTQIARLRVKLHGELRHHAAHASLRAKVAELELRISLLEKERRPHPPEIEAAKQQEVATFFRK